MNFTWFCQRDDPVNILTDLVTFGNRVDWFPSWLFGKVVAVVSFLRGPAAEELGCSSTVCVCDLMMSHLKFREIFHGVLILFCDVTQAKILINSQAMPLRMAADELHF